MKKILVVDDETAITKLLKFAIEKAGIYQVLGLNEGAKAMETIRSFNPDLVILDINMPDKNGGEILSEIQEDAALAKLPIIFLTGSVSGDEEGEGLSIDGHPALSKPIHMQKLMDLIAGKTK